MSRLRTDQKEPNRKEKPEKHVNLIRMSDVEFQPVVWLWYPFIPFGKITIIQGDPGEGKTTLALRLAAACSTGEPLPGMECAHDPFNVIYQTAEDGIGDTIKPRLVDAGADERRIFYINEEDKILSLLDERIETAIRQANARLLILDPLQGYLGSHVDMNRANEIRSVLKKVADVAERTGCAIVLVGHLNKAAGISSAYRGLGSIDFRAAARSVLLIGRLRNDPTVRIVVHDKSSLAPEGHSVAFSLGDEEGFHWLGGFENITSDELLSGISVETKTSVAEDLIRDMLSSGREVEANEIFRVAEQKNISRRTVNEAKKNITGITTRKIGKAWTWSMPT